MLKLVTEEGRDDIGIRVLYYRHHDQSRHNKFHVLETAHLTDSPTYQIAKDHKIEPDRNRGRH